MAIPTTTDEFRNGPTSTSQTPRPEELTMTTVDAGQPLMTETNYLPVDDGIDAAGSVDALRDPLHGPSETAIRAEGLVRSFGGIVAVDRVDLAIRQGEIYGFLGPNGAGKSTMVRVLCTLLAPSSGRAVVAGYDVADQPDEVRLHIGVALQEAALDPKQTGRQLLRLQAKLYGLTRPGTDRRIAELEQLIDIGEAIDRPIATYSGGMKRRLDLAAALVHDPAVLFLDEPTTGLDPVSRVRIWEEVRRLNRELGMTIFLTTQYLEEADQLADRVAIINSGRIVAEDTPDELKRRIGSDVIVVEIEGDTEAARRAASSVTGVDQVDVHHQELVITTTDGAATISDVAVALNAVSQVRHLTLRTPTLDDVFLELTGNRIDAAAPSSGPEYRQPDPENPESLEDER
jgi:ABC-2 type transport system ATP-binding protein